MLLGLALPHNSAAHSDARPAFRHISHHRLRAGDCDRYAAVITGLDMLYMV
jgi:hypothetical protein